MDSVPPPPHRVDSGFIRLDMSTPAAMDSQTPHEADYSNHANFGNTFIDPQDKFWSLYLSDAEKYDKFRIESWQGDAEGILIFTGLFAATVATFTVASYSMLSPDPHQQTAVLLTTLIALSVNGSQGFVIPAPPVFQASTASVCVNALWIISLFLSLACALAATLVQQWTRRYAHHVQRRAPPHVRGPIHVVLSMGLRRFGMKQAVAAIICTLHLSVALFLAGLGIYMSSANDTIAFVVAGIMGLGAFGYCVLSVLPLACTDSPYKTPFTPVLRLCVTCACGILALCCAIAARVVDLSRHVAISARLKSRREQLARRAAAISSWTMTLKGTRVKYARDLAKIPTIAREKYALKQTMKDLDEVHELETFCDALLVVVQPADGSRWDLKPPQRAELVMNLLTELHIIDRIGQLFRSRPSASEPNASSIRCRHFIVGFRLARALMVTIVLEDHEHNLVETIRNKFAPLIQTWKSIALNRKHPDTAFIARCFLSVVRADVCSHQLSVTSSAPRLPTSVYLTADLAPAGAHALPAELVSEIYANLQNNRAENLMHSYLCQDYVHFLRDILQLELRDDDLLEAHNGVWQPLFFNIHDRVCKALGRMDGSCLDRLQAVLMHVHMCHRKANGTLFEHLDEPDCEISNAPDDEYRQFFSRYPDMASELHYLWARIRKIRSDGYYCTCYHHFRLPAPQLESPENSMTASSSMTLSNTPTIPMPSTSIPSSSVPSSAL